MNAPADAERAKKEIGQAPQAILTQWIMRIPPQSRGQVKARFSG